MSDHKGSPLVPIAKSMIQLACRLLAVGTAFACRVIALALNKLSELLEKASGNGRGH